MIVGSRAQPVDWGNEATDTYAGLWRSGWYWRFDGRSPGHAVIAVVCARSVEEGQVPHRLWLSEEPEASWEWSADGHLLSTPALFQPNTLNYCNTIIRFANGVVYYGIKASSNEDVYPDIEINGGHIFEHK